MSATVDTKVWIEQPNGKITFYSAAPQEQVARIVQQARRLGYAKDVLLTDMKSDARSLSDTQRAKARKRARLE